MPRALLAKVEENPAGHLPDRRQRCLQLVTAVAAQRTNGITRETFGVQAHRDFGTPGNVTVHEGGVFLAVPVVPECDNLELAEAGGQLGDRGDADADLVLAHTGAVVITVLVQELFYLQVRERHSDKIHSPGGAGKAPGPGHPGPLPDRPLRSLTAADAGRMLGRNGNV